MAGWLAGSCCCSEQACAPTGDTRTRAPYAHTGKEGRRGGGSRWGGQGSREEGGLGKWAQWAGSAAAATCMLFVCHPTDNDIHMETGSKHTCALCEAGQREEDAWTQSCGEPSESVDATPQTLFFPSARTLNAIGRIILATLACLACASVSLCMLSQCPSRLGGSSGTEPAATQ